MTYHNFGRQRTDFSLSDRYQPALRDLQHGWLIEMEGGDYQIQDNPKLAVLKRADTH
ncbi:hypothetical protein GYX91_03445 [Snodgrassella sp. ESL0304]|uniref:hypothetical protein n=1 Tax=Snodgrassella sp. ESL0304 TaxID=2705032 RepID=UPI001583F52D|nr:hypothetical protein [Snodgrassella sp. ESL0304]NUE80308.1 hypothetical protein [Snodgrassella sp. ESL0304]